MKNKLILLTGAILILLFGVAIGLFVAHHDRQDEAIIAPLEKTTIRFDDTAKSEWGSSFEVVEIPSRLDEHIQKAYFYRAKTNAPRPLIVSLHTWSGSYRQYDEISKLSESRDFHYIHPDFRGQNSTRDACCSALAMEDIDDAIAFARAHANVDSTKIFVTGVSGGGYATLSTLMKSRHPVRKFSAWASISDLAAWYQESSIRKNKYADNILACTGSDGVLNEMVARQRSPLYWKTPVSKLANSQVNIYAGIFDGIQGSVPITHSINFYNKLLRDCGVADSSKYVTIKEKLQLMEYRKPIGDFGEIDGRKVCLMKQSGNIKLVVFEGNHEMLTTFAFNELVKN